MKTREEMSYEFCSQLHEQYAIADSQKTNIVIYFIVSITFIFSGYGIFLEKYYICLSDRALLFFAITILVSILLLTLSVIIINYGYTQRRDQFIINIIREIYFVGKTKTKLDDMFQAKGKTIITFLPNNYFIIYVSCLMIQVVFSFLSYKLLVYSHFITNNCCLLLSLFTPLLLSFTILIFYYFKYKTRERDFYDKIKVKPSAKKLICSKTNLSCCIFMMFLTIFLLFSILPIINFFQS